MVCGHGPVSHPCRAVRSNIDGGEPAGPVQRGDVVRHVHGNPAEHPDGLVNRLAHLEYVAHDDGDTEPLTDFTPAAEGQRDRQPRIVDAVEQPPEAVGHAKHAASGVGRLGHDTVEQPVVPVVVADQGRAAPEHHGLRAPGQKGRGIPQRQRCPGVGVSRKHPGKLLPGSHELGHVLLEPRPRLGRRGAGMDSPL